MRPSKHPSPPSRFGAPMRSALVCGTALAFFTLAGAPAFAGELDDMKAQLEALQKRIEQLEGEQKAQRKILTTVPRKKIVTSGKDPVKLTLSGQVNRVSFFADDGTASEFFHSDNENSSTRWRLVGSARVTDDWTVGTLIEQDIGQTNNSSSVRIQQDTSASDDSFDNRHLTFWLDSKRFGRLWLGKGDPASNNITQFDLSGTSVIEYSGLEDIGGNLRFRAEDTDFATKLVDSKTQFESDGVTPIKNKVDDLGENPIVSGGSDATGDGVYSQFDGLSRRNRIQYDTPTIMGFKAGFSHIQGDAWDATLRYTANYKQIGLKVAAGIGYWDYGSRNSFLDSGYGGSASFLHKSGANLTFSAGTVDRESGEKSKSGFSDVDDPVGYFIKPGWQLNLTPFGKTAVSFHYGRTDDMQEQGDEFESWGFAIVQHVDRAALELFAFFRQYSLDRDGEEEDFEDINIAGIGGRVKF